MRFKIGDKVRVKQNCSGCYPGNIYTLKLIDPESSKKLRANNSRSGGCSCVPNWILVAGVDFDVRKLNKSIIAKPRKSKVLAEKIVEELYGDVPF